MKLFKIQALMMFAIHLVNARTTNPPITEPITAMIPTGYLGNEKKAKFEFKMFKRNRI
jgi:hypothetical protein